MSNRKSIINNEDTSSIEEIKEIFDPKKINIDSKVFSLDLIIKRLKAVPPEIDLYPNFQRMSIWDDTQQSHLIESILIRIPLPIFYFDGTQNNKWLVIDGLQRLTAIKRFVVTNELKLKNMEFLEFLEGRSYKDIPKEFQRRLLETNIVAYLINPGTPDGIKFNIFQRINTRGKSLNNQEIRHALNQGIPSDFVAELAELESFKLATDNVESKRMKNRELVTRFISFYLLSYQNYQPSIDSFLNEGMKKLNDLTENELKKLKNNFDEAMKTAYLIFGYHTFRKQSITTYSNRFNQSIKNLAARRKPLNKAVFDIWSVLLAKLTSSERQKLIINKKALEKEFIEISYSNKHFKQAISQATNNRKRVLKRFNTIENLINKTLAK